MGDLGSSAALALAVPAYNEADGIEEFLTELDEALAGWNGPVTVFVVDDASRDDTRQVLDGLADSLALDLVVETNAANSGHGPTVLRAYRLALDSSADVVLQVDGDGQFDPVQCRDLFAALDGADVAAGVRTSRTDPWFRKVLSATVRLYLRVVFDVRRQDPNCPFRAYHRAALVKLIDEIEPDAMIPTIYLSVLESKLGLRTAEVPVRHRVRRGTTAQGTTWGARRRHILIPTRLVRFVGKAFKESVRFWVRLRNR